MVVVATMVYGVGDSNGGAVLVWCDGGVSELVIMAPAVMMVVLEMRLPYSVRVVEW